MALFMITTSMVLAAPISISLNTSALSGSACDDIPLLPDFCQCKDLDDGAQLLCSTTLLRQDLAFSLRVAPCDSPAQVKFDISIDGQPWSYTVTAGQTGSVDIPGLSFGVAGVSAGAVLDYALGGNAEALKIDLGIDACASAFGFKTCGSSLTSELPLEILDEKIHFGACFAEREPLLAFEQ